MNDITHSNEKHLFDDIRHLLQSAKSSIQRNINSAIVQMYWQVGKYIVEYEQQGNERAEYGSGLLKRLSAQLIPEFGNGFNLTNLKYMRLLYLRFQKGDALCHQLSWSHIRYPLDATCS